MGILSALFRRKTAEARVLIDIGASSVAGAYIYHAAGQLPTIVYSWRVPIERRPHEAHVSAMLRALSVLGDALLFDGAPALVRVSGSGTADSILVSIDAPWQQTAVHTEQFEGDEPFTFTKSLIEKAIVRTDDASPGSVLCDTSIVGTLLNGYPTHDPVGKSAHRATVITLSSFIERSAAEGITNTLRGLYHTRRISLIAGGSVRYQAIRAAFPHEHDLLILDVTGPMISLSLVRRDLLVAIIEKVDGTVGDTNWVKEVTQGFGELAKENPLPHTMFLLTREHETTAVESALASAHLGSLWLSENPPKIVSVLASHLSGLVRQTDTIVSDVPLLLLAVYATRAKLL